MGQQQSKNHILDHQQNYSQIQKQQHPFLGTIIHLNHKTLNTKNFLKVNKYASQKQLTTALKRAQKRRQLSQKKGSNYIVKSYDLQCDRQNQLCGITYYLYSIYEDYQCSLGDLIRQRSQIKNYFTEDQVLQVVKNICNGLIFLQDNGYKNYTITKQSIVKGSADQNSISQYKIFDTQLARQMLPYLKILNHIPIQKSIYLSPEALKQLSNKNLEPELSLKSDIFQLGMVVLQMCHLQPLDSIYDYDKLKLNTQQLTHRINNIQSYSPYLKSLIQQMLQLNDEQRIGPISLRQKLLNNQKLSTQYGHSGIGNSNVTQRTHKLSYPTNPTQIVRQQVLNTQPTNPQILVVDPSKMPQIQHKIPRVLTVQQIKGISHPNSVIIAHQKNFNKKNQTFDQINARYPIQMYDIDKQKNNILNKSTDKCRINFVQFRNIEQRKRVPTFIQNHPFYVPAHVRPIQISPSPIHTTTIHNNMYQNTTNRQIYANNRLSQPQLKIKLPENQVNPTLSQHIPNNNNNVSVNPMHIKVPEILIQQNPVLKNMPLTPINNLNQSVNLGGPNNLAGKMTQRGSLIDELEVLTSINAQFRKAQSYKQETTIFQNKNDYQSPNRPAKSSIYALNQSTPIRKIQALALQSNPRTSFDQIIKEAQEQNQNDNTQKKIQLTPKRDLTINNGPKTYGRHHFTNGAVYQGQFDSKGNFYGNGVLYYPNGKVCYSGGWVDNSFHGFGVLNNENVSKNYQPTNYENFNLNDSQLWHHYEGQFSMDKKNGFGTLYMSNGDKFSGCFLLDVIQGYGTFTSARGEKVSGIWSQNILKKL